MPALTKVHTFSRDCLQAVHDFSSHTFKALLTNSAPNVTMAVKADVTEIAAGNGYAAGGPTIPMALSTSGGVAKVTATDTTITASGGPIGPFRYAVLYNDTSTGDRLVGFVDYGSSITLQSGDPLVLDFDGVAGLLTGT